MSQRRSTPDRRVGGVAGALAVALALGIGELLGGLLPSASSPIIAVGSFVIERTPAAGRDLSIALFGTANKTALVIGTAGVTIFIGSVLGRIAVRRFGMALSGIVLLGVAGAWAGLVHSIADPLQATSVAIVSTGVAAGALWLFLRVLGAGSGNAFHREEAVLDRERRRLIRLVVGSLTVTAAATAIGRWRLLSPSSDLRAPFVLPNPVRPVSPLGRAHAFDIRGLDPIIVPNHRFFRIDTALEIPRIDPDRWRLRIIGLVDREVDLTLDDLLRMPLVEKYVTLACVSNEVGGHLVGNAKWTGVPLRELLQMAGVKAEATQLVGRAVDGWTAGFPRKLVFDGREPLVAVGMNGEPLPPQHGFPARLVVPGLYGYVSATKWLAEIELTTWEGFDAYWVPHGWAKEGPIKMQSRIDVPRRLYRRVPAGQVILAGVAWAPLRGVDRVEVQVDGDSWEQTQLTEPLSDAAWVQWRRSVDLAPGRHRVAVRATDGAGMVQTAVHRPPRPDGAEGHHTIEISAI